MIHKKILVLLSLNGASCFGALSFKPFGQIVHHMIAGAPAWLEALKHGRFLSTTYTRSFLGDEPSKPEEAQAIHSYLQKHLVFDWHNVPVYHLKPEIRMLVPYPCICTDQAIYINPNIFPYIDEEDKKRELLFLGKMIQKRFMAKTTASLALLPMGTHTAIKLYTTLSEKMARTLTDSSVVTSAIRAQNYVLDTAFIKFLINRYATDRYFAYQKHQLRGVHGQN